LIEFCVFVTVFGLSRVVGADDKVAVLGDSDADDLDERLPVTDQIVVGSRAEQPIMEIHRNFEGDAAMASGTGPKDILPYT
jgi:hypothetical protein